MSTVSEYRNRRALRLLARAYHLDADDIQWISTEDGTHIPLNKYGEAIGGPLKGREFTRVSKVDRPKSDKPRTSAQQWATKWNSALKKQDKTPLIKVLDDMPVGSKIYAPDQKHVSTGPFMPGKSDKPAVYEKQSVAGAPKGTTEWRQIEGGDPSARSGWGRGLSGGFFAETALNGGKIYFTQKSVDRITHKGFPARMKEYGKRVSTTNGTAEYTKLTTDIYDYIKGNRAGRTSNFVETSVANSIRATIKNRGKEVGMRCVKDGKNTVVEVDYAVSHGRGKKKTTETARFKVSGEVEQVTTLGSNHEVVGKTYYSSGKSNFKIEELTDKKAA